MYAAGKIFVETYLKAIRDFLFFSQYVEFLNRWYFYSTEGEKLNFYTYREILSLRSSLV